MVTSLDGLTPFNTLRNPYPAGLVQASGSSQGPATLLGQAVNFTDRGNLSPYAVQWNFNVQHELPGALLVEVGYIGSHGVKFPENRSLNQLLDSSLALKDDLRTQVPNPFFGQITSGFWRRAQWRGRNCCGLPAFRRIDELERQLGELDLSRPGSQSRKALCQRTDDTWNLHLLEID